MLKYLKYRLFLALGKKSSDKQENAQGNRNIIF